MRPSDAELVARAVFALRAVPEAASSSVDERLRRVLAGWAVAPEADLDRRSLAAAAGELRDLGDMRSAGWADLLAAVAERDEWLVLVARYRLGESSQRLARELGVSDSTLLARLSRGGVPVRAQGGGRHDAVTKRAAVAMYLDGASAREVAAEYMTAKTVILDWVRASGAQVRPPRTARP